MVRKFIFRNNGHANIRGTLLSHYKKFAKLANFIKLQDALTDTFLEIKGLWS